MFEIDAVYHLSKVKYKSPYNQITELYTFTLHTKKQYQICAQNTQCPSLKKRFCCFFFFYLFWGFF